MSTRIHTGHLVVGHTLESFLQQAPAIRAQFQDKAQALARQFVMNYATGRFDTLTLNPDAEEKPRSYLGAGFDAMLHRQDEVQHQHMSDPILDYAVDVTLFPVEGRLLAISYIANRDLRAMWVNQPWWADFSYWDNADEPDDMSADDWNERKRLWDLALPDHRPPAQRGLSLNILANLDAQHPMTDALFEQHRLSFEDRARMAANRTSDAPAGLHLAENLSREEKRTAILEYVKTKLVPELTIDMLRGRV